MMGCGGRRREFLTLLVGPVSSDQLRSESNLPMVKNLEFIPANRTFVTDPANSQPGGNPSCQEIRHVASGVDYGVEEFGCI
jgi:hypothetical protein